MTHVTGSTGTRLLGDAVTSLLDVPTRLASTLVAGTLARQGHCGCEIPPPCWEPRLAGRCALTLAHGSVGTIRLHVNNCGWAPQRVAITALGRLAAWLSFEPTHMILGPQERRSVVVRVRAPEGVKPGTSVAGPLLVLGCLEHFVRVEVTVAECEAQPCCEILVDDCQDQVHHWYDHFYCPRPCRGTRATRGEQYG